MVTHGRRTGLTVEERRSPRPAWPLGIAPSRDAGSQRRHGDRLGAPGVIAFVTGRLFHGLVALLPMMWGAAAGAAAA